jgi:hypothetical protein
MPAKVVVRLLPGNLSEDEFKASIPSEFSADIDYIRFVPGRVSDRPSPDTPNENARGYINFRTYNVACDFITKFHGKSFTDSKNEGFRAVAAFAPFQRNPRPWKQLRNAIENTIEEDQHYFAWLENEEKGLMRTPSNHTSVVSTVAPLAQSLLKGDVGKVPKKTQRQRPPKNSKQDPPPMSNRSDRLAATKPVPSERAPATKPVPSERAAATKPVVQSTIPPPPPPPRKIAVLARPKS